MILMAASSPDSIHGLSELARLITHEGPLVVGFGPLREPDGGHEPEDVGTLFVIGWPGRKRCRPTGVSLSLTRHRDGSVNRDGSDLQGRRGHLGGAPFPANPAGTWNRTFIANDQAPGCQFFANVTFGAPVIAACFLGSAEETDNFDVDLQASFSSFDDLIDSIWKGLFSESDGITLDLVGLRIDSVTHPIAQPVSIQMRHNGFRPDGFSIVASDAAMSHLIDLLKAHTSHLQPVTFGLSCAGGLQFDFPSKLLFAVDHVALAEVKVGPDNTGVNAK